MIEVPKLDAYLLNVLEHQHGEQGAPSLDVIATEHYGRKYFAQQTGDMLANDSWTHIVLDQEMVAQYLFDGMTVIKGEHLSDKPTYLAGRKGIENWLALPEAESFGEQLRVDRAGPTPELVLADMIDKGLLPHGNYLLHCWW